MMIGYILNNTVCTMNIVLYSFKRFVVELGGKTFACFFLSFLFCRYRHYVLTGAFLFTFKSRISYKAEIFCY